MTALLFYLGIASYRVLLLWSRKTNTQDPPDRREISSDHSQKRTDPAVPISKQDH